MHPLRSHISAFISFLTIFSVSGCAQHLEINPGPTGNSSFCTEMITELPVKLADQLIRSTTPPNSGTAAWGDPAITLRCGVPIPASLRKTSQLIAINGIDWFQEPLTRGNRFTSVNTSELVEIDIPDVYEPASSLLVDLRRAFPTS